MCRTQAAAPRHVDFLFWADSAPRAPFQIAIHGDERRAAL